MREDAMDRKRILIVDDESGAALLLKLNLEQTNDYVVRVETLSTEALVAAAQFRPDLILLDVMMPGADGGEVANRLRASPDLKQVPIVFFTAAATKREVAERDGQIGGLSFLAKPADLREVIACFAKHLGTPGKRKV